MIITPGPVEVPETIRRAEAKPMIHHRTEEYHALHKKVVDRMNKLVNAKETYIIPSSGTGGIEACFSSMLKENDRVLIGANGKFGERMGDIAKLYCKNIRVYNVDWCKGINLERIKPLIDSYKPTVLGIVYNETSTALANPIEEICKYAHKKKILTIVDGISAVGGFPINMKRMGVDALITGSQKCLGLPTGISLVSVREGAIKRIDSVKAKSYYFNLRAYRKSAKKNETPWSSPVSLVQALEKSLRNLWKTDPNKKMKKKKELASYTRKKLSEMGFKLMHEKGFESASTVGFYVENAGEVKKKLASDYGLIVAGGQGELKGKVLRIGIMGRVNKKVINQFIAALCKISGKG